MRAPKSLFTGRRWKNPGLTDRGLDEALVGKSMSTDEKAVFHPLQWARRAHDR